MSLIKKMDDEAMQKTLTRLLPLEAKCMLLSADVGKCAQALTNWIVNNAKDKPETQENEPFRKVAGRFIDAARCDIDRFRKE